MVGFLYISSIYLKRLREIFIISFYWPIFIVAKLWYVKLIHSFLFSEFSTAAWQQIRIFIPVAAAKKIPTCQTMKSSVIL